MEKTEYQLKDRRPIARIFRLMGFGFVDFCVARGVHPDTVSYFSLVFAACAFALLALSKLNPWMLLVAPLFFFLRLYCNMIDGMIAVKANMTSARGEVINELPDRISDTVIFAGIALSGHANALVTCWVIFGMLLVSYIGVLGKAVGAKRQYGGIMPKPNRMFILAAACWIRFFLPGHAPGTAMTVVDIANGLMLAGLAQTAIVRTRAIFRELAILEGKRTA